MNYPEPPQHLEFTKSPYSSDHQGCVELAFAEDGGVWLRDSKDHSRPAHFFTAHEWECFARWMDDGLAR